MRFLSNPNILIDLENRTAGSVILRISHGYQVKENRDPFVEIADKATEQFSLATAPGGFLVDLIPACKLTRFLPFVIFIFTPSPKYDTSLSGSLVLDSVEKR